MQQRTLEGQVVVVTGASSGIGRAIATTLSAAGARVALFARREERLREVAATLATPAVVVAGDVAVEADVARLVEAVLAEHGRIDGLVNNAGLGAFATIAETSLADWQRMLDVNLTGSFLCARAMAPGMVDRGDGWIVNVCSDVSRRTFPGGGAYCASKFGQYALSLTLGAELRPAGVRVGAVLPGMVQSEFAGGEPAEPNTWILQPQDVADAVLFMATRPARAVVDELVVHPVAQEY